MLAVVTIPAHVFGLRGRWPAPDHSDQPTGTAHAPREIVRSRPFLLLVPAIALGTFAAFAVVVNQVPLLIERGMSTSAAAWALGLGGLGQVLGRLGYGRLTTALSVRARGVVILGLSAAATLLLGLLLGLLPGPTGVLIAAAMLAGAARGVFTLLQATAISDRWGAAHYGRLNGLLSAPAMVATALAPWAGAAIAAALGAVPPSPPSSPPSPRCSPPAASHPDTAHPIRPRPATPPTGTTEIDGDPRPGGAPCLRRTDPGPARAPDQRIGPRGGPGALRRSRAALRGRPA